jgi:hypothetical protein
VLLGSRCTDHVTLLILSSNVTLPFAAFSIPFFIYIPPALSCPCLRFLFRALAPQRHPPPLSFHCCQLAHTAIAAAPSKYAANTPSPPPPLPLFRISGFRCVTIFAYTTWPDSSFVLHTTVPSCPALRPAHYSFGPLTLILSSTFLTTAVWTCHRFTFPTSTSCLQCFFP